jgi:hypothetical protein
VAGVGVEDADSSAGGSAETHHEFDGSGFTGAVGTEESDDLTTMKGEGEVVEGEDAVGVALGDVGERGYGYSACARWGGRGGCGGLGGLEDCAHGRLLCGLTDTKSEYGRELQRTAVKSVRKAW